MGWFSSSSAQKKQLLEENMNTWMCQEKCVTCGGKDEAFPLNTSPVFFTLHKVVYYNKTIMMQSSQTPTGAADQ